jgi:DNA polymerase-3 subunit gamma/tau
VPTALYRRYRPERFQDVIGQEHVTGPLMAALDNDRVSHAYLFSGPRGCGKTTSARILARCLNCEQGVSSTPCGQCDSCQALSRDGAGSLDVVEIDAASHGGVDDARDLRERAFFAPASSRYKIYIIDEAHMVSREGFNALLKIVEEPPPHLKFVFATTAPDKVLGTIRSRTHHYPFRLVPPRTLQAYLAQICESEGVRVDPAVLPLVVRAGGGSVRDSLSVLDQLIAGASAGGVTYGEALGLLGYTDTTLLDEVVDAFAARDGARVFEIVDQLIEAGHDPRRFVEDLLERLRDLIVLSAAPQAAPTILSHLPADQLERMTAQARRFGPVELSRAADLVNTGLTEMRGATAPRLQLELICARVLLPAASTDLVSVSTRLERLERRAGAPARPLNHPTAPAAPDPVAPPAATGATNTNSDATANATADRAAAQSPSDVPADQPDRVPTDQPDQSTSGSLLASVRNRWPEVLDRVRGLKRLTWTLLVHNASVLSVDGTTLVLGLVNAGARDSFTRTGSPEIVRQALIDVLDVDWRVEAVVDPTADPAGATRSAELHASPGSTVAPASAERSGPPSDRPASPSALGAHAPAAAAGATDPVHGRPAKAETASVEVTGTEGTGSDDPELGLSGADLLARELGASVIAEYDDQP